MIEDVALILLKDPNSRRKLTKESLYWFGRYYFGEYFTHNSPDFHLEMVRALQFEDGHKFLIEEMFKESAKTSWAKIAIVWRICHKLSWFIGYVCHDKGKAEAALYDIAVSLQTNEKIIEDYGQLFYEESLSEENRIKKSKKKSIDEFITNDIKVKAFSTAISTRGEVYKSHRPDYFTLDDFENEKTKKSIVRTKEVRDFIDELLSGTSAGANLVFLCNKISNKGSVTFLEQKAFNNKDFKLMKVPLVDKNQNITWESKFVWTDLRADFLNSKQPNKEKFVFSIEERKRTLGTARFNQEYQLIPIDDSESIIQRKWLENHTWNKPLDPLGLKKIIMSDPQSGEKTTADFMGICVLGFYRNDPFRYVLETKEFKGTQLEQAAELVKTYQRNPTAYLVGVEKLMTQVAVYQLILAWKAGTLELKKYGVDDSNRNIPLMAVDPEGKDKVARMQMHQAAFERGEISLHQTMNGFIDKLASFPDVDHDDDCDALMYCLDFSYKSDFSKGENDGYNDGGTVFGGIMKKKF